MVALVPGGGYPGAQGYPSQAVGSATDQGVWSNYEWIVVCGALAAVFMAWGIGANDVANSFATSVGSRTLKLWQACIIAGIFEFVGAMVLGGEVTKTIATDIADVSVFNQAPEIYMYGMLVALTSAGIWLLIATYSSLAVSTTHSIIGAIVGFCLVYGGADAVTWNKCKPDFPYATGMLPVFLSWFVSPIMSGILAAVIFNLVRFCILRRKNSTNMAFYAVPVLLLVTFFINVFFVLAKGAKKDLEDTWPPVNRYSTRCSNKVNPGKPNGDVYKDYTDLTNAAAWIAAATSGGIAIFGGAFGMWYLRRKHARHMAELERKGDEVKGEEASVDSPRLNEEPVLQTSSNIIFQLGYWIKFVGLKLKHQAIKGLHYDVHAKEQDLSVSTIHNAAEVFDPQTEHVFGYLQVVSACCVAFAHGANDVANAIGPFAAIWAVYNTWQVPGSNAETPKWLFVLGGAGIVVGLMTYGYNIIMELGVSLLKLTPSRGFSAELATGLTISLASAYGLPVSTTQVIVGAETGVGMSENIRTGLNYPILLKTFLGWIATLVIAAMTSAAIFAMGVYSPSVMMSDDILAYRYGMGNATTDLLSVLNRTNYLYQGALVPPQDVAWWTMPEPAVQSGNVLNGSKLNTTLASIKSNVDIVSSSKKDKKSHFYVDPEFATYWLRYTVALYKNMSAVTIGQNATAIKTNNDNAVWLAQPPGPPPALPKPATKP